MSTTTIYFTVTNLKESFKITNISWEDCYYIPIFRDYLGTDIKTLYVPDGFHLEMFFDCLNYFKNINLDSKDLEYYCKLLECVDSVGGDIKPLGYKIIECLKKRGVGYGNLNTTLNIDDCFQLLKMYETKTLDYKFLEDFSKRKPAMNSSLEPFLSLHLRARILFECF